jgi:hypothetical protein
LTVIGRLPPPATILPRGVPVFQQHKELGSSSTASSGAPTLGTIASEREFFLAAWGISFLWRYTPPEIAVRIANPEVHIAQDSPLKVTQDKPFDVMQSEPFKIEYPKGHRPSR